MKLNRLKGTRALIVDDEPLIREMISYDLESYGVKVFEAKNGKEALEIFKQEDLDFIISDIQMPGGSGIDLLKNLQAEEKKSPLIIIISGFCHITSEEAKEIGAFELFSKPFNPDEIFELIAKNLPEN